MNRKKKTPGILTYAPAPAPSSRERIKMPYTHCNTEWPPQMLRIELQFNANYFHGSPAARAGLKLWWIYSFYGGVVEFWWAKKFVCTVFLSTRVPL